MVAILHILYSVYYDILNYKDNMLLIILTINKILNLK